MSSLAKDTSIWADQGSRAMEVLGGEPLVFRRDLSDKVTLTFTTKEWLQIFNIHPDFMPCNAEFNAYNLTQPIEIHFIRRVFEGAR